MGAAGLVLCWDLNPMKTVLSVPYLVTLQRKENVDEIIRQLKDQSR